MQLIVHGGAGGVPEEPAPRQSILDEAATAGAAEPTPVDAVETAVRALESSPRFNAGTGSCVQSDGFARTDAGVMTDDLTAGAACSMPGVEHAVSVARVVAEETPHVLVSGVHAVDLADAHGVPVDVDLLTDRTRQKWTDADAPDGEIAEQLAWIRERFGADGGGTADPEADGTDHGSTVESVDEHDHDTVGAVAVDGDRVAAATSTGGRWLALAGRVGDVPQIGSGFYANEFGGASATGAGEDIARVTLSRLAVDELAAGHDADAAAERAIEVFEERTGSSAGVIVCGTDGSVGSAFNSDGMQTAVVREDRR